MIKFSMEMLGHVELASGSLGLETSEGNFQKAKVMRNRTIASSKKLKRTAKFWKTSGGLGA